MILFSFNQAHLEKFREAGYRYPIGQESRIISPSDLDSPTGSGPILVFGPCPRMGLPPRCFMSLSDRLKFA